MSSSGRLSAWRSWLPIVGGLALLVGACAFVALFAGVIMGLLFPPTPPLPPVSALLSHESRAYGSDVWHYSLPPSPCDAAAVYAQAGTCAFEPSHCGVSGERESALVATCTGIVVFSEFEMHWQAVLHDYPAETRLLLSREISWGFAQD